VTLISLEAAIAIGGGSRRTWWRRISENPGMKKGADSRGRTMLSLTSASEFISIPDEHNALATLVAADAGDLAAQNDAGLMFAEMENQKAAIYWWRAAADQGDADAMHHLGRCYTAGFGVIADENTGIMWIAKAAATGHLIAHIQIQALRPNSEWRSIKLP
jgi:hypothetical protein